MGRVIALCVLAVLSLTFAAFAFKAIIVEEASSALFQVLMALIAAALAVVGWISIQLYKIFEEVRRERKDYRKAFQEHAMFVSTAFDREAFRWTCAAELCQEHFVEALCQTADAIVTGELIDRESKRVREKSVPLSAVTDPTWHKLLRSIDNDLRYCAAMLRSAEDEGVVRTFPTESGVIAQPEHDPELALKIDNLTVKCLKRVNRMMAEARLMPLPTQLKTRHDPYEPESERTPEFRRPKHIEGGNKAATGSKKH